MSNYINYAKTVKSVILDRQVQTTGKDRARITSGTRLIINRSDKMVDIVVAETGGMIRYSNDRKIERTECHNVRS
jgi:hypothetical protein